MTAHVYRLPKDMFLLLYKNGTRSYSDSLQYIYVSSPGDTYTRFSVVVGKKIHKHAVQRNRMKRIVREAMMHLLPSIHPSIDCVIIVKKDIADQKTQQIEQEIRTVLHI